jgi:hypothetical protein
MASPLLTPVMTLPEYLKGPDIDDMSSPLIEMFAKSSDIMQIIPFEGLTGPVYEGYRQGGLPTSMAFRGVNEPSTSGAGILTPFSEAAYLIDHDIVVDRAVVDAGGERRRALEEKNGMARLGELWVQKFLKGDNTTQPREFSGLQKRSAVYGRTWDNSAGANSLGGTGVSGGAPLSFAQLDWAIQNVKNATHIICPWYLKSRWIQAARNTALTGYLVQTWDELGKPKLSYAGMPILFGYDKDLHAPILPFTEVAPQGGAAQTSSIYVVSFGEEGVKAIQRSPMRIMDMGLLQDGITYSTHISWTVGLVTGADFCFARLAGITNSTFIA